MEKIMVTFALVVTFLLSGCGSEPTTVVILVDATTSIDSTEYQRCRGEIERRVQNLKRGDRLVLVPITGEPEELLGPRIVHIDMPTELVPYDSNLKRVKAAAAERVQQFLAVLPAIQAKQTDIMGALRATADAFRGNASELLVLSDMVEDEQGLRFPKMPELATLKSAEALAEKLAKPEQLKLVKVSLGILKSYDLERMHPERREAVQAFWRKYFLASGASNVQITVDLETLGK